MLAVRFSCNINMTIAPLRHCAIAPLRHCASLVQLLCALEAKTVWAKVGNGKLSPLDACMSSFIVFCVQFFFFMIVFVRALLIHLVFWMLRSDHKHPSKGKQIGHKSLLYEYILSKLLSKSHFVTVHLFGPLSISISTR